MTLSLGGTLRLRGGGLPGYVVESGTKTLAGGAATEDIAISEIDVTKHYAWINRIGMGVGAPGGGAQSATWYLKSSTAIGIAAQYSGGTLAAYDYDWAIYYVPGLAESIQHGLESWATAGVGTNNHDVAIVALQDYTKSLAKLFGTGAEYLANAGAGKLVWQIIGRLTAAANLRMVETTIVGAVANFVQGYCIIPGK